MQVTKEDVTNALSSLGNVPAAGGEGTDVSKSGDGSPTSTPGVSTNGDLNSANGAATGGGDDGSLGAPGSDMSDKAGKGKVKPEANKSTPPPEFQQGLPSEVETKVEVSEFLKSLVDHTATQINGLRDFVVKSDAAFEARTEDILDSFAGLEKSMANIGVVLKAVCERIGIIENQPQMAKSQTAEGQPAGQPVQRTFEAPQGDTAAAPQGAFYKSLEGKSPDEVRKSISNSMIELVKKGELEDTDVINFDTYNYVSAEADTKLRAMLNN